jgi:hypothetical protein
MGSFGLWSQKAALYPLEFDQVPVSETHVSLDVPRIQGIGLVQYKRDTVGLLVLMMPIC